MSQNDKKKSTVHNDKKAAVLNKKSKKSNVGNIAAAVIALVIAAVAGFILSSGGGSKFKSVIAKAGLVQVALADVSDGAAHYFTYKDSKGKDINFFVLKSSDGIYRAAFDACDVCYREKLGYRQESDDMVCNNCGQKFPSVKVNVIKGGCNPAPIERSVSGKHLVLKATDLEGGRKYF